ncbi:MAG: alpha/beta hydrolase [Corynebacterium sp.]|nr:alpha/beta hydrolase [Corynebacterium sp.]
MPPLTDLAVPGPYEHTFVHTRGLRLHAAICGDPNAPLALLLHSSASGWFEYQHILPLLADAGYRACALSFRGYGLSDRPPTGYEIRHAVGDSSGTIRALGHSDAIIIGNGTGGSIAWALAAAQPKRVRTLITLNAIHPTDLRRAIAARPWLYTGELLRWPTEQLVRQPLQPLTFTRRDSDSDQRVSNYMELYRLAGSHEKANSIILKNTKLTYRWVPASWFSAKAHCPVLILHNNQQRWKHLLRRAATRTTSQVSALSIPDSFAPGTLLPQVEHPTEFTDVIVRYLRSL